MANHTCSACKLPISLGEGTDYLGDRVRHRGRVRCVELLRARISQQAEEIERLEQHLKMEIRAHESSCASLQEAVEERDRYRDALWSANPSEAAAISALTERSKS